MMTSLYRNPLNLDFTQEFISDCSACSGICCVALFFFKIDGFPYDKKASNPCCHLQNDYKCDIHSKLVQKKLNGCVQYDCLGAGEVVTKNLYKNKSWQEFPALKSEIWDTFAKVFQLQQIRWYMYQCLTLTITKSIDSKINDINQNITIALSNLDTLHASNLDTLHQEANVVLKTVSANLCKQWSDQPKKPLFAKSFKQQTIRDQDFSMTSMIGSDFSHSTLVNVNFLGADLRQVNFSNANLYECLFLTQMQINAAIGNHQTLLPPFLVRPLSWI